MSVPLIANRPPRSQLRTSDAVLNHKMGGDEKETFLATMVDENDRTKDVSEKHDIQAWTK